MDDDHLYALHARFKAGEALPDGWYREGEPLGEDAWAVNLDLFMEVSQDADAWQALRGKTFELEIGETVYEIDLPEDVSFEECWTLEGAGLFEPAPGVTEEQLAEAEDFAEDDELGRFGDLHVVPLVS